MPVKTKKVTVIPLGDMSKLGAVLLRDEQGRYWYLEEVRPGTFLLKPWNGPLPGVDPQEA